MITIIIPAFLVKIISVVFILWAIWLVISTPLYVINWVLPRRIAKLRTKRIKKDNKILSKLQNNP